MKKFLDVFNRFNTVKNQVAEVLEENEDSRNSDKILICVVLEKYYKVNTIMDLLNQNVPTMEAIRRARQRLQADGFYPSDKRTEKTRALMETYYRDMVKY